VEACAKRVLGLKDSKVVALNPLDCTSCRVCEKICPEGQKGINIGFQGDAFVFRVEGTGALPPERIVAEAARSLKSKADEFVKQIREIKRGGEG